MKVLALNDEPVLGGAAQLFRRTNELLRRAGHEVITVTGEDVEGCRPAEAAAAPRERLGRLGALWADARGLPRELRWNARHVRYPKLLAHLAAVLRAHHVDVAHVHNVHERLSTAVLSFLAGRGIPTVCQVNDYFFFCNTHFAYNRRLAAPCKRCIGGNPLPAVRYGCVSYLGRPRRDQALIQALKRWALVLARPWRHVHLFLVTSEQAAELLEEWGVDRTRQHRLLNPMGAEEFDIPTRLGEEVVFYGSCLENKGTDIFLQALEQVRPGTRIGVYLVGMTADYGRRLAACAQRRGLALRADTSLRWHSGLQPVVAEARAVVVPSQWWVTSENVVYEAQLLGKPVIVSRIGGNAELVDHGETGFLFEPRSSAELAGYINRLGEDAALAGRMGRTAAARARERFAETAFVSQLEAGYRAAIARAGAG